MNKIFFAGIFAFLLFGCIAPQQNFPGTGPSTGNNPPIEESFTVESAKIRYDLIGIDSKETVLLEDDGHVTVFSKKTGSTVQEMKSEQIAEQEVKDIVIELSEKEFFSAPEVYGNFDAEGETRVLEVSLNGETKNMACRNSCPENFQEVIDKIEVFIFR